MVKVRAHGQALKSAPPFARRDDGAISPLISGFRLQIGVASNRLLDLRFTFLKRIGNRRERLCRSKKQFTQTRSVERFIISGANCPGRIQRLPTRGDFRSLAVAEIAEVVVPFLVVQFQAVQTWEVPSRARYRHAKFPIRRPNVAAAFCRREVRGASRLTRCGQRVWVIARVLPAMFTANSE